MQENNECKLNVINVLNNGKMLIVEQTRAQKKFIIYGHQCQYPYNQYMVLGQ
jgi:hypothetical protein